MDAFAVERTEVLAAWDELRERARQEGEAVALSPAFRDTLDRHGALMKQAASFRARPQVFERLLSERAGIGKGELRELGDVHARAGSYLRSVTARATHARQAASQRAQAAEEASRAVEPVRTAARPPERSAAMPQAGEAPRRDARQHEAPRPDAEGESEGARRDTERPTGGHAA